MPILAVGVSASQVPAINQVNHTPDKRGPCPNLNTYDIPQTDIAYAVTNPDYFSKTVTDTSHAEDWD
ncbi:hypothetical protein PoMZ_12498 [Pyricularia oryzae]|uniref:Uncharacterized protein n=1 Tax=Pyricularia oryzae TaxID=318829 RepID=A0A4P7NUD8_PYROR|nr:hypothetical protein PoMZ_12498 [Pyricularia oryzae]